MRVRGMIVGVVAVALCVLGMTIALLSRHDGDVSRHDVELSPDCQHVDVALRAWARVIPDVQQAMASGFGTPPDPRRIVATAGKSAAEVRIQATLVKSSTIRTDLLDVAGGLDLIGRSRVNVVDITTPPNSDLFRGYDTSMSAAHALVIACPGVGDPPVPGIPVRPS